MHRVCGLLASCLIAVVAAPPARAAKAVDGVININTAEVGVLGLLPGIGPAKAAQIVVYRKRRPFRTVDELVRIRGIGRKMVRQLRAHLAVAGPTTATGNRAPPVRCHAARTRARASSGAAREADLCPSCVRCAPGARPASEARAAPDPRQLPSTTLSAPVEDFARQQSVVTDLAL